MIELHEIAIVKAQGLINIGAFLCIFPLSLFGRVAEVSDHLEKNELFASDLEDLIQLISVLIVNPQLSLLLKQDMADLAIYLNLKIQQFGSLPKACTQFTHNLGI